MSGRHRQPQHVGAGPGIARGDGVDQPTDLRGEHRLGGHHAVQPGQLADVIGLGAALQDEPVDQPAVEAQPHPHTWLGVVGLLLGHQVVEFAVQMRHRQHRQHPRDRLECGGLPGPRGHSPGVAETVDTRPKKKPGRDQDLRGRVRPPDRHRQRLAAQHELADADHRVRAREAHRADRRPRRGQPCQQRRTHHGGQHDHVHRDRNGQTVTTQLRPEPHQQPQAGRAHQPHGDPTGPRPIRLP